MNLRIDGAPSPANVQTKTSVNPKIDRTFSTFLTEAATQTDNTKEVKISRHAQKRLEERGLQLESNDMQTLESAFDELNQKGSRDSLIFFKDMALIASIDNRTIITAQKTSEMRTVTNIDSAIHI